MISVGISGLGYYVPETIVTNSDLEKLVDTSHEWIVSRTGIEERRKADSSTATSDLAVKAARSALEDAICDPLDVDLIIVATATPDFSFPNTAALVQKSIGAVNAACFDVSVGCSGFIYAMCIGESFIKSKMYERVLVIGAETLSKIVNWKDRDTCVLFGDGAGAALLERCDEGFGVLSSELGSDGVNADSLIQLAGGSRNPASPETVESNLHTIKMDGKEVFKFAVRTIEKSTISVIEKASLNIFDIDFFVPHQANIRIIEAALKKLKLPKEKTQINLNKYGNMSAASIPIALCEAKNEGKLRRGDNILMLGFGAGLSWASMVLKWSRG